MAEVVLVHPEGGGLDAMLAGLIAAAVEKPDKAALLDSMRGTVTIVVPDAEVEVGLRFADGVCSVSPRGVPGSGLRVTLASDVLLGLSTVPLLMGLPSVLTPDGRAFTRKVLTREVRIGGLRHVVLLTQLTRLLSLV